MSNFVFYFILPGFTNTVGNILATLDFQGVFTLSDVSLRTVFKLIHGFGFRW